MLVIRDAQRAALTTPARERFARRLAEHLAEAYPRRFPAAEAPATAAFVRRTIDVALRHGVTTERDVAGLAMLRAECGEDFELTPVAAQALALLHDPALPGPIKLAAIRHCLHAVTGGRTVTVVTGEEG